MKTEVSRDGTNIFTVVQVVFLILKLCGLINWSWWWVLSPLWISVGICIVVLIGFAAYRLVNRY